MTHQSDFCRPPPAPLSLWWGAPHSQTAQNSQLGARQQLCEVTAPSAGLCCNQQAPKLPDDWWTWRVCACRCLLMRHQPCCCPPERGAGFKRPAVLRLPVFFSIFCLCFILISTTFSHSKIAIVTASLSLKDQTACRLILFIVHQHFCRTVEESLAKIRN